MQLFVYHSDINFLKLDNKYIIHEGHMLHRLWLKISGFANVYEALLMCGFGHMANNADITFHELTKNLHDISVYYGPRPQYTIRVYGYGHSNSNPIMAWNYNHSKWVKFSEFDKYNFDSSGRLNLRDSF